MDDWIKLHRKIRYHWIWKEPQKVGNRRCYQYISYALKRFRGTKHVHITLDREVLSFQRAG